MTNDLNTLLTALYVAIDGWLDKSPQLGRPPKLTDAELLTLAVTQVLPGQSGYNKRLHKALPLLKRAIRELARDTDLWSDPAWVAAPHPSSAAAPAPPAARSWPAGPATATALPIPAGSGVCACT
ncbi:hypothetical protein [Nonomuraea sp. NPDC050783]|uniref:hypothetical protein n=1 Tax=Nonomuraea sp. NPDC050783 TaxID=3154634 RepID=UPI003467023B